MSSVFCFSILSSQARTFTHVTLCDAAADDIRLALAYLPMLSSVSKLSMDRDALELLARGKLVDLDSEPYEDFDPEGFNMLRRTMRRMSELDIASDRWVGDALSNDELVTTLAEVAGPQLRTLTIGICGPNGNEGNDGDVCGPSLLPLTTLNMSMTSIMARLPPSFYSSDWPYRANLQSLKFNFGYITQETWEFLQSFPNLVDLDLVYERVADGTEDLEHMVDTDFDMTPMDPPNLSVCSLSHLKHLRLDSSLFAVWAVVEAVARSSSPQLLQLDIDIATCASSPSHFSLVPLHRFSRLRSINLNTLDTSAHQTIPHFAQAIQAYGTSRGIFVTTFFDPLAVHRYRLSSSAEDSVRRNIVNHRIDGARDALNVGAILAERARRYADLESAEDLVEALRPLRELIKREMD